MRESTPRIGVAVHEQVGEPRENYLAHLRELGAAPVELEPAAGLGVDALDGLVLTGGIDVDPALYGERAGPHTRPLDRTRDDYEIGLLRAALDRRLPVLAICRGNQLLNVALGGGLLQHIGGDGHRAFRRGDRYISRWHPVSPIRDTRLSHIYREAEFEVNSRHHQAITPDRLAPGLRATAFSPDGLVEGLELEQDDGAWLVGVQWHPERPEQDHPEHARLSRRLFEAFLIAVKEARRVRPFARAVATNPSLPKTASIRPIHP